MICRNDPAPLSALVVTTVAGQLMLNAAEVAPDLRVLVTGDSHVEGVCANSESCASVLERLLAEDAKKAHIRALELRFEEAKGKARNGDAQ